MILSSNHFSKDGFDSYIQIFPKMIFLYPTPSIHLQILGYLHHNTTSKSRTVCVTIAISLNVFGQRLKTFHTLINTARRCCGGFTTVVPSASYLLTLSHLT